MEYSECLLYWYEQNIGHAPDVLNFCTLIDRGHGMLIEDWKVEGHDEPTFQELKALEADAMAWNDARKEDKHSPDKGYKNLPRQTRFLLHVIFKVAKGVWPNLTWDKFKKEARAEWDATKNES